MLNASRSSQDALPFASGDNKRVRFEWSKESLRIIEMERDLRFRDNSTNNKLVMEIPVEHVDFQCTKDKYGDCTNSEEERSDIDWGAKGKFKIKGEAAKSARLEVLPILLDSKLDLGFCYSEVSARVVDLKIEKEAFNMAIERTFNLNAYCSPTNELSDTTVAAVFHYSMVKADSILTPGFLTKNYPRSDENTFGFFKTERQELDSDNNASEKGLKTIANHWSPNRSEITYYLSDNFEKSENKKLKELTQQVVDSLNFGLNQAGAKFRINLKSGEGRSPGDIRNSMIVLVEDPVASSIIGYGPQTEDPVSGEIVSARTVMFLGTIKTIVRYTYDDIIREKRQAKLLAGEKPQEPEGSSEPNGGLTIEEAMQFKMDGSFYLSRSTSDIHKAKSAKKIVQEVKSKKSLQAIRRDDPVRQNRIESAIREFTDPTRRKTSEYRGGPEAHLRYLNEAKNCAFGLDAEILSGISPKLMAAIPDDAKPWQDLSESEKQQMMDIILPEIWVPTLIHEMGHNLGLRHNFGGSEDAANFYSAEELKKLGVEHEVPASTVMEYINDIKALPVLGKYDIAALRFIYAGKIELADGSLINVDGTIEESVEKAKAKVPAKEFKYCSDEHTGINAGCRRFDLGTTMTQIIENEIKTYLNRYDIANRRAGRANMSLFDDPSYAARLNSRFTGMRLMQEVYERIKNEAGLSDDAPEWNEFSFLADLKTASTMVGQFLMSVAATPDLTCLFTHESVPGQIADIARLETVRSDLINCFDLNKNFEENKSPWRVIGQFGKLFNSKKDPNSSNSWADQIDVRGYWLDKLVAARVLFKRDLKVSSLDRYTDNFTDRSDLAGDLANLAAATLLNKTTVETEVEFREIDPESKKEVVSYQIMQVPTDSKLMVDKPIHRVVAEWLGVPNDKVSFNSLLASTMDNYLIDSTHILSGGQFLDNFRVHTGNAGNSWPADHLKLKIGDTEYIASPNNKVAAIAISMNKISEILSAVPRSVLVQVLAEKEKGHAKPPALAPAEVKAAWALDAKTIETFLNGGIESPNFYKELLISLPRS